MEEIVLTAEQRYDRIKEIESALGALSHPGWTIIQKRFQEAFDMQDSLIGIADERQLYAGQGRLITLREFLDLRDHLFAEQTWLEEIVDDPEEANHYDDFGGEFINRVESE